MNTQVTPTRALPSQTAQAGGPVPTLTLRDKYHIQRAVELVGEGEERHTLAGFLGLADDEHLHEQALIVALNHLDTLVAIIERLTGNEENGIAGDGGGR